MWYSIWRIHIYTHTHINIHKIKVILEQAFKNSNYIKRISGCLETYFRGKKKKESLLR